MRLVFSLIKLNLQRLGRRLFLLAAIAAAFLMLSAPLGAGVRELFSREDYGDITIAVAGKNGEGEALASFAGNLADVAEYCRFVAMPENEALAQLERGELTAVLVLPENFVNKILTGENQGAKLHLDPSEPVESLLTLYAGQCAADMLAAAQGGIYAVLDALDEAGAMGDRSVEEINLEYIRFTMGRGGMYETELAQLVPGGEPGEHYVRSVLVWVLLMSGLLFYPVLGPGRDAHRERLRSVGCTGNEWAAGALAPLLLWETGLSAVICLAAGEPTLFGIIGCALFAGGFSALVCAISFSEASAAAWGFILSTALGFLSGGIVPPALMPGALRGGRLYEWTSLLRRGVQGQAGEALCLAGALLTALAFLTVRLSFGREART
ncbi:MAG: hypothetical protein ACOX81_02500 [Candidatus Heteroscillospira sp.]|jgi:ABC-2 type transport system permease protein